MPGVGGGGERGEATWGGRAWGGRTLEIGELQEDGVLRCMCACGCGHWILYSERFGGKLCTAGPVAKIASACIFCSAEEVASEAHGAPRRYVALECTGGGAFPRGRDA